jgi:hypothetical protein
MEKLSGSKLFESRKYFIKEALEAYANGKHSPFILHIILQ